MDTETLYQKYAAIHGSLKLIITIYNCGKRADNVKSWNEIMEIGKKSYEKNHCEVRKRMDKQNPATICTLVYTSGTTGNPKGVMLTHDNIIYCSGSVYDQYEKHLKKDNEQDRLVSFLPLCHVLGILTDLMGGVLNGLKIFFAKPDVFQGSLVATLKEARPTLFVAVPRIYEKFEEKLREKFKKTKPITKKVIELAFKVGKAESKRRMDAKKIPVGLKFADSILIQKIKKEMGIDKVLFFGSAGAPIQQHTLDFFTSLNIIIMNIYGLSEVCGPCIIPMYPPFKLNTSGRKLPGTIIKIEKPDDNGEGELCIKGRGVFSGYIGNLAETMKAIDDQGFFHSGDSGKLDSEGYYEITGRIKELIKTSGGEYVAPVPIEEDFKFRCKICNNVVIIGEQRTYLVALITLKGEETKEGVYQLSSECLQLLKEINSSAKTVEEAIKCENVRKYIDDCVSDINKKAGNRVQAIKKWAIIPRDFSINSQELTPTLKLRRKEIIKNHTKIIEGLYNQTKI